MALWGRWGNGGRWWGGGGWGGSMRHAAQVGRGYAVLATGIDVIRQPKNVQCNILAYELVVWVSRLENWRIQTQ